MPVLRKRAPVDNKGVNGLYVHSNPPRILSLSAAYIKQLIRNGDIEKLEQVVLEGQGKKLVGEYSADFKTRSFLKSVPSLMSKISLLHDSVNSDRLAELQSILDEEPERKKKLVMAKDESGVCLLHKAVYYDLRSIYRWLIDKFPQTVSIRDSEGRTPYFYSLMCKDPASVQKLLLIAGADPHALDYRQHSTKYYANHTQEIELPCGPKSLATSRKSTASRESLNFKKSNIRIWIHQRNMANLQQVVWEGHGSKLLVEHSNNPKMKKFLEAVPFIMGLIKDVHCDVQNDDLETLKHRIAPPVPIAVLTAKDSNGLTPLHKAVGLGRTEIVHYIINEVPHSINAVDNEGRTPLHYAALLKDDNKMSHFLIENGADESALDSRQKTAAYYKTRTSELDSKFLNVVPDCPRGAKEPTSFDWSMLTAGGLPANGLIKKAALKIENGLGEKIQLDESSISEDQLDDLKEDERKLEMGLEPATKNGHAQHENGVGDEGQEKSIEDDLTENVEDKPDEKPEEHDPIEESAQKESNEGEEQNEDKEEKEEEAADEEGIKDAADEEGIKDAADEETSHDVADDEEGSKDQADMETPDTAEVQENSEAPAEETEETEPNKEEENPADETKDDENNNEPDTKEIGNEVADDNQAEENTEGSRTRPTSRNTRTPSANKSRPASQCSSHTRPGTAVKEEEEQNGNQSEHKDEADKVNTEAEIEGEGVIEGIVNGENEVEPMNNEGQNHRGLDDLDIKAMIDSGDMEQLAALVLNGDGDKLIGQRTNNPELQTFLENVPIYMSKIKRIHEAARDGSLRDLQAALDRRKFAVARDNISPNGASPLHVAVAFGRTSVVRYLAGRFPETIHVEDDNGRVPLHYAAVLRDNGHYYNLLMHLGADNRITDKFGHVPEYYIKNQSELNHRQLLIDFGAEDEAEELLNDKDNIIAEGNEENGQVDMPFFATEEGRYLASSLGDPLIKGLTEVANKRPGDPIAYLATYLYNFARSRDGPKPRGKTQDGHHQKMISGGPQSLNDNHAVPATIDVVTVEPNDHGSEDESAFHNASRDEHGQSMLHFASARAHGRNALFQLLIETEINVAFRDELYRTARDISIQANMPGNTAEIDRYVLHIATKGDTSKLVELLLDGYDHITDVVDEDDTSIIEAVSKDNQLETVSFLQSILAFEEKRERVHHAIRQGSIVDTMALLADENDTGSGKLLAIGKNSYGRCSLHIAVLCQQEELVDYLANTFVDTLRIGDNLERTALHYAMGVEKMETISRLLIKAGAKRVVKDLKGRQPTYYFLNKSDILRLQEEEETF